MPHLVRNLAAALVAFPLAAFPLVAFPLVAFPLAASAETPGADWLTPAQTRAALKAAGYSEITKLEADDGHWDGEGIKDGRAMKFDADPKTGAILGEVPVE